MLGLSVMARSFGNSPADFVTPRAAMLATPFGAALAGRRGQATELARAGGGCRSGGPFLGVNGTG